MIYDLIFKISVLLNSFLCKKNYQELYRTGNKYNREMEFLAVYRFKSLQWSFL